MKRTSLWEISDKAVKVLRTVVVRMKGMDDSEDEVEWYRETRVKGR